jgi:hypothetical protein
LAAKLIVKGSADDERRCKAMEAVETGARRPREAY